MPDLTPGVAFALSPLVRRIVTAEGVNTYLVGIDEVVVIDPGASDAAHLDAIVGCGGDRIRWVVITHSHRAHAEASAALAERTGAQALAHEGSGAEAVADGDTIEATEFRLAVAHTPGHAPDHLCFVLEEERLLFSGDHVRTPLPAVEPPEGDLAAWCEQTRRLARLRLRALAPGHGDLLADPRAVLEELLAAVERREQAVAAALGAAGQATVDELVAALVGEGPEWELPAARTAVWAHLRKLAAEGRAAGDGPDQPWRLA